MAGHTIIQHASYDYCSAPRMGSLPAAGGLWKSRPQGLRATSGACKHGCDSEHYLVQCAWYMAVTDVDAWDVAVLFHGNSMELYEVRRDKGLEKALVEAGRQFWNDYVLANTPPPIDASLAWSRYLGARFASSAVR